MNSDVKTASKLSQKNSQSFLHLKIQMSFLYSQSASLYCICLLQVMTLMSWALLWHGPY